MRNEKERINVWLSKSTISFIDSVWPQRDFKSRSAFVDEALRRYAQRLLKASLKKRLKDGYRAEAAADRKMVNDWEIVSYDLPDPEEKNS